MKYVITTGENYIRFDSNGRQETTTKFKDAKFFETEEKANNVLKTLRGSLKKFNWVVKGIGTSKEKGEIVPFCNPEYKASFSDDITKVVAGIQLIYDNIGDIDTRITLLINQLSAIDREVNRGLHTTEFTRYGTVDGYKVYKALGDKQRERRKIKNEIELLKTLKKLEVNSSVNSVLAKISEMESRVYFKGVW